VCPPSAPSEPFSEKVRRDCLFSLDACLGACLGAGRDIIVTWLLLTGVNFFSFAKFLRSFLKAIKTHATAVA